ncbi:AMP-binding protein [Streptomyces sp. NPDC060028]|uniref:AMP-binding protein n=1 Tax=Streptomyces sp. NPDC060028 TaxID=3347041 RepID=UPI0036BBCB5A
MPHSRSAEADRVAEPAPVPHRTWVDAVYAHARDGVAAELGATCGVDTVEQTDYPTFWRRVVAFATGLRERGVRPGEHVALVMQTSLETMIATVGVQAAGGVLVPLRAITRPRPGSHHTHRARDTLALGEARWCLAPAEGVDAYADLIRTAGLPSVALPTGEFTQASVTGSLPAPPVALDPGRPALLQFSSGSTCAPKGILLTHRNLAANATALNRRVDYHRGRGVFWLPLSHDMGLIGCLASSLFSGSSVRAVPPETFARDPLRWITELSAFRATHTAGPPFGYELAGRKVKERLALLSCEDLSALRVALIGAERISPALCAEFERTLAPLGLRPHVLLPAYGLAENCVAVATRTPLTPTTVRSFDRRALGEGRLVAAADRHGAPACADAAVQQLVGHGAAVSGTRVRITAIGGGRDALPDGRVGEIHVGGDSATARTATAGGRWEAAHPDGFVPTGDLGAFVEGELFVVGRLKESFKYAGLLYAPADLEAVAAAACPESVTAVVVVPVAPQDEPAESIVVFLEYSPSRTASAGDAAYADDESRMADTLRLALRKEFHMPVRDVFVVARGMLPRTASGKVQRTRLAAAYLASGAAGVPGRRQAPYSPQRPPAGVSTGMSATHQSSP